MPNYKIIGKNVGSAQNRDNQCPTIQTTSGKYVYRGAYNDQAARAIPNYRNPTKLVQSVDECATLAESERETVFGIQNNGECWTGNNESDAYKYEQVYDRDKINPLGTDWTNMVYVRTDAFPDPEPPEPTLRPPNFSDTPIESFSNRDNNNLTMNNSNMSNSKKICGLILLILFIIILLIIYRVTISRKK
jgi:hypothetical protein